MIFRSHFECKGLGAVIEALQGGLENRRKKGHLFQGNKGQILRGTKTILGDREHEKTFLILGKQGNTPIYFSGTRE